MSAYYDLSRNPTSARPASNNPFMPALSPRHHRPQGIYRRVYIFHRPQPQPAGRSDGRLYGRVARLPCQWLDGGAGRTGLLHPLFELYPPGDGQERASCCSIALRGLNFRLGREFYKDLKGKMQLERCPQSASAPASSADEALGVEQRWQLLDEYLQQYPCINRSQYARLAGRSYKQAVVDLNRFIEEGVLMRHGMGPSVVYARKR